MKSILFTCCVIFLAFAAQGQLKTPPPYTANGKTTGIESRLISSTRQVFDGTALQRKDSTKLVYTGNNGWNPVFQYWQYDQAYVYEYKNGTYKNHYQINRYFNALKQLSIAEGQVWDDVTTSWLTETYERYVYTLTGQIASELSAVFNGSYWDSTETYNTYNNNLLTEAVERQWDNGTNTWTNSSRSTISYNTSGQPISRLLESWNMVTAAWENAQRLTFTYQGILTTSVLREVYTGNTWQNIAMTVNTYDANSNLLTSTAEIWSAGAWQGQRKLLHTYNATKERTATIEQVYSGGAYLNRYQTTMGYNGYHQLLTERRKTWNTANNQFEWGSNDYEEHFYYEEFTNDIANAVNVRKKVSVYPVPATHFLYLQFRQPGPSTVAYTIYATDGRKVMDGHLNSNQVDHCINVSALLPGNYTIHITDSAEVTVEKFLIVP